jgi:saccharopine dehydrogenase-like NADP-dependent oxidoreductase
MMGTRHIPEAPKRRILVLGAGKIGIAVAQMLHDSGDYDVGIADSINVPDDCVTGRGLDKLRLDVTDRIALRSCLERHDAVVSALPFFLNEGVAEAARAVGVHYFDPTEDVRTARKIREIAKGANAVFVPQCGLAPGFISIVAHHLVNRFDEPHDVRLRVGALPQFPDNALKYNLTWSTDGLINEYCNPCEVIHEGERRETVPLEGLEHFTLDGNQYEAFPTSGGVGSLCETLAGRVRNLNYKTIRYPGHRDLIKVLVDDLKMCSRRNVFKDIIEHGIPMTLQDVVIIFVTVRGMKDGKLTQESYVRRIYANEGGSRWSAIQLTTASAVCAVVDLCMTGRLSVLGFVKQEQIDFDVFIANRFGRVYA